MSILLAGVQLGNLSGGPTTYRLEDLSDVLVSSAITGNYLRYNATLADWQNQSITADVYSYLTTNLTSSNGVVLTQLSGAQSVNIALSLGVTGDATGNVSSGSLALTLATVNTSTGVPGTFGSASAIPVVTVNAKGQVTAISSVTFGGNAPIATNLANGTAGAVPYQSAPSTTVFLSAGTTSQVMISGGTGPSWTNTPSIAGTNFTIIPNGALSNSAVTIGSTSISLGATSTTLSGLTSVTSSGFTGVLTGTASIATTTTITNNTSGTATVYPTWSSLTTGNASQQVSSTNFTFVPSTGVLSATSFSGAGTGLTIIPNSALTNSSITVGTTAIALGTAATIITGLTSVTSTGFTGALTGNASGNVLLSGSTMTGSLILNANPTTALGAATKQYVDTAAAGLNVHAAVETSTTSASNLPSNTYTAGSAGGSPDTGAGVGATLSGSANGVIGTVGGFASLALTSRILVKDQTTTTQNGVYIVTSLGSASTVWVITRASDYNNSTYGQVAAGDLVYISQGTNAGTQWVQTSVGSQSPYDVTKVGTDAIAFTQFAGSNQYIAGTGLSLTGNTFANTGVLSNVAGTNIAVSSASGNVTISVTGTVASATTAANVPYTGLTGTVTTWNQNTTGNAATATALSSLPGGTLAILYNNSGTLAGSNTFTYNGVGDIAVGKSGTANGTMEMHGGGVANLVNSGTVVLYDDLDTVANLYLYGGTASGLLAYIVGANNLEIEVAGYTAFNNNSKEVFRITSNGGFSLGTSGTNIGTTGQVLQSTGTTGVPVWSSTPTLTGTNFTGVSNSALTNSSLTLGSTSLALGSTTTTIAGLTSVTSTGFTGALTGNASTATNASNIAFTSGTALNASYSLAVATGSGTYYSLVSGQVTVNPSTGALTAVSYTGSGSGLTGIPNTALTNSAVTINGTSISLGASGTVTAAASTITGTVLNSTVVSSSLTSVGTLTSLTVSGAVSTPTTTMTNGAFTTVTYTSTATTAAQVIDTVLTANIRTVKYLVQATSGTAYQICEILILHDGTTPSITQYGDILTGASLATFDATIATGNLNLVFTPVNAATTVKVVRTTINV